MIKYHTCTFCVKLSLHSSTLIEFTFLHSVFQNIFKKCNLLTRKREVRKNIKGMLLNSYKVFKHELPLGLVLIHVCQFVVVVVLLILRVSQSWYFSCNFCTLLILVLF